MAEINQLKWNGPQYPISYDCKANPIENENLIKVNCHTMPLDGE